MKQTLSLFQKMILIAILFFPSLPSIVKGEEASSSVKTDQKVEAILFKIRVAYEKIDDLQAEFIQKTEILDFNVPVVSKGQFFLKKGKMRWDYNEPSRQQIFVNGGGYLYYVPGHKQVIRSRVGGSSDAHLPLKLLSGLETLEQDFAISLEENAPSSGPLLLRLVPKKKMGLIKIVLAAIPTPQIEGLIIQKAVLHETNGNISTSFFEKIKINKGIKDDFFVFEIPKGIEVLDAP